MDIKKALEYAVVLAPAILAILVLVIPLFKQWLISAWNNQHLVEIAKELAVHAAFFGSAATAYFGYAKGPLSWVLAIAWFASFVKAAYILAKRTEQLFEGNEDAK